MKEIIATTLMFLFFPKKTIQNKAAEFYRMRKERYKREEYISKNKYKKFNYLDLLFKDR